MFYYPNVLQRHTGCFATIWLVATKGIQVNRRDLINVNVKGTCRAILEYITAQVPAVLPNQPRPRFSLYLSSQLQYGVVMVYYKQCGFLLEEIQQTIQRLLRQKKHVCIDMVEPERMLLDVPDRLYMMEEMDGAQDPFFGLLESHQLPGPNELYQADFAIASIHEQNSLVGKRSSKRSDDGFSSPAVAITLRETERVVINTAEHFEGGDLPEATAKEIDLLMEQPDLLWGEVEREQTEEDRREAGSLSSIDRLKETVVEQERENVCLRDEELGRPVELPGAAAALELTPQRVAMPTSPTGESLVGCLNAEGIVFPLRKRGRRRQLVFVDDQVQISDSDMKEQTANLMAETLQPSEVFLDFLSVVKHETPAQLFGAPCGALLHPDLLSLWKQQASVKVQPGVEEREREVDELEQGMEILRAERKRRQSSMKETSSSLGIQLSEASSVSDALLEMCKDDKLASGVMTPASRWSLLEEAQPPMEPIMEENIEMPEVMEDRSTLSCSWITSTVQKLGGLTFDFLLPPNADRSTVAHTLQKLLELLSEQCLTAHQQKPYADIHISPATLTASA